MRPTHIGLAVLVTFIWGVNFTFIAWALESFPPLMLTAMRFFFTAVPLVFFLKPPKFDRALFIYAIGTFVMQYAFVFTAMHLGASAGLTALLLQVQIFITVLLAYVILGEVVKRMQIIGMVVGVLGLGVIALNLGGDMPCLGCRLDSSCTSRPFLALDFGHICLVKIRLPRLCRLPYSCQYSAWQRQCCS